MVRYLYELLGSISLLFHNSKLIIADLNECEEMSHNCSENAICTNSDGSYDCTCMKGYTGNGTVCKGKFFAAFIIKIQFNSINRKCLIKDVKRLVLIKIDYLSLMCKI